jgi:hypothetical protein
VSSSRESCHLRENPEDSSHRTCRLRKNKVIFVCCRSALATSHPRSGANFGTYPINRKFEVFWNTGASEIAWFCRADRNMRVTKEVIFGTPNRVSRRCSNNPKLAPANMTPACHWLRQCIGHKRDWHWHSQWHPTAQSGRTPPGFVAIPIRSPHGGRARLLPSRKTASAVGSAGASPSGDRGCSM